MSAQTVILTDQEPRTHIGTTQNVLHQNEIINFYVSWLHYKPGLFLDQNFVRLALASRHIAHMAHMAHHYKPSQQTS